MTWKPKMAVVCENNVGRSMVAQYYLSKHGYDVRTFGVNMKIELPGRNEYELIQYHYGTTYDYIYRDLKERDEKHFACNNMLEILDRNRRLKQAPERFNDTEERFDIIFTVDQSVFEKVAKHLLTLAPPIRSVDRVHIFNIDVDDTTHGTFLGSLRILNLIEALRGSPDFEEHVFKILYDYETVHRIRVPYFVPHY